MVYQPAVTIEHSSTIAERSYLFLIQFLQSPNVLYFLLNNTLRVSIRDPHSLGEIREISPYGTARSDFASTPINQSIEKVLYYLTQSSTEESMMSA